MSRNGKFVVAIIGAAIAYLLIVFLGFLPIAISECLPRSDPLIRLCDAEKQREVSLYLALLVVMPMVAGLVGWRHGSRTGLGVLIFSSPLPMIATICFGMLFG
jgi:hypothetical protein